MSAHDNYQTPLASRYASSGEYPAIPAPHRLISDCLTLAVLEAQVLTCVFGQTCGSFLVREREVRHGANFGYG